MNVLDILIAVFVLLCAAFGLWKGFVRIAVGIAGLSISLAFALRLSEQGPAWFSEVFSSPQVSRVAAFVLVLVIGLLATGATAFLAHKLVKSAQISWVDRLVGGGVGIVGSALVICGILVGVTAFLPPGAAVLEESMLLPYAIVVSDIAASILPPEMARIYAERRRELKRRIDLSGVSAVEVRTRGGGSPGVSRSTSSGQAEAEPPTRL